jgi:glutathione S-transferase
MKLYFAPGACSIGIHVLLEEIGKPYELVPMKLMEGEQYQPSFTSINPKSKVPTLVLDDGAVLTEFPAIAWYLARTNPQAGLIPEDPLHQARVLEAMDYAVSTVHMQAFARLFRPANFAPNAADHDAVKARGRETAEKGYARLEAALSDKDYVAGGYSVADAAVFYVEFWGAKRMGFTLPPLCAAHYARMLARPAVARVMQQEGFGG